ncbi:MAG: radical SAM protein [Synergistaceae bacterium]|nr:radical SAM protein [Synergistaceae bacterium]
MHYVNRAAWSITGKCNYKCRHCYLPAPDAKYGELSHDKIMKMIPQLDECGIKLVSLTGGEPLVRNDFLDIVDSLLEHNIFIVQIYSNGVLVNEKLLDELDSRGIHPEFNMSYDGLCWHDWLRGINGAEDMVNRAFALCREKGFPTSSEMCLHRLNRHTIRESVNHLASLGVKSVKIGGISESGEWEKHKENNTLSITELFNEFLSYIPNYYEDNMPITIQLSNFFSANPNKPDEFVIPNFRDNVNQDSFICGCARFVIYISPEGRVMPCMSMQELRFMIKCPFLLSRV